MILNDIGKYRGGSSDEWQRIEADIGYFIIGQMCFHWIKTFKTLTVSW